MTEYLDTHEKELERIKLAYEQSGKAIDKIRAECIGELLDNERSA